MYCAISFFNDVATAMSHQPIERKIMATYYILTGIDREHGGAREVIFGDYDKGSVEFEKLDSKYHYRYLRVTRLSSDSQDAIDSALAAMQYS